MSGATSPVIDSIRGLIRLRDTSRPEIQVTISMVLTADNIHEAADFVRLGNELGVTTIYLRTLMPFNFDGFKGLNYHLISPKFSPQFEDPAQQARAEILASKVRVESQPDTWGNDSLSPKIRATVEKQKLKFQRREDAIKDRDVRAAWATMRAKRKGSGKEIEFVDDLETNPYGRSAPFKCRFVYQNLVTTNLSFEMYPCCYMAIVPGHENVILDPERPFIEQWNNPAFQTLRRRLQKGPLYQACATCPMQG